VKLITFGDSWVFGIGAEYQKGMSRDEYGKIEKIDSGKSWRGLLSKQHTLKNINFSIGGSSNQMQFRKASEFYIKNKVKKHLSKNAGKLDYDMIVLWGLTSVYRTELFNCDTSKYENLFLPTKKFGKEFSEVYLEKHFNEEEETTKLYYKIELFNSLFKEMGLKNYWFNVFNEHKFPNQIDNLLFDGKSLLSLMISDYTSNDHYHRSTGEDIDRKIIKAKQMHLVNPYSLHPNSDGHKIISEHFNKELDFNTAERR
tara:strand:- start:199 stop:966 length:768 start_codon:yes stop_codon:yes gene_type:complete